MDWKQQHRLRLPLCQLESELINACLEDPDALPGIHYQQLRYIISFARLTVVQALNGTDVVVAEWLSPHRWWVLHQLKPFFVKGTLIRKSIDWNAVILKIPELIEETIRVRDALLGQFPLDRYSLEAEICQRQLGIAMGGGGGSGYGYVGALRLLDRYDLQPSMMAGTSIGALIGMFRARTGPFDMLSMIEIGKKLSWNSIFRVLDVRSRYGVPATLRLYLRSALGPMMSNQDGSMKTFRDLAVPLIIAVTGLTVDAFKHDMIYYEHLMDDAFQDGVRISRLRKIAAFARTLQEFLFYPEAMKEVIFGADEVTMDADVIDAAGFSSAVPGLLHYDILREDPKMHAILGQLYAEHNITRLGEGGLINNLPARPLYAQMMSGRIKRRNPVILAIDCFAPQRNSFAWLPVQQLIQLNVRSNMVYADVVYRLKKRLSPINVIPSIEQQNIASDWTILELQEHVPRIRALLEEHPVLNRNDMRPLKDYID
ncbi:MAG: hypothetical protein CMK59_09155 [Proteobacteria bacterium]|nr:hypothetical protein [Pseudomonadota bacterium]